MNYPQNYFWQDHLIGILRYKKAPKGFGLSGPGAELWTFEDWGPLYLC